MDQRVLHENQELKEQIRQLRDELREARTNSVESNRNSNLRGYKNYRDAYSSNYLSMDRFDNTDTRYTSQVGVQSQPRLRNNNNYTFKYYKNPNAYKSSLRFKPQRAPVYEQEFSRTPKYSGVNERFSYFKRMSSSQEDMFRDPRMSQKNFERPRITTYNDYDSFAKKHSLDQSSKSFAEEEDELSQRIKSLKSCIKEIEEKQDHLLNRIETKIQNKPKYEYETERSYSPAKEIYRGSRVEEDYDTKAREYERKISLKTKQMKKKFLDPYTQFEENIPTEKAKQEIISMDSSARKREEEIQKNNEVKVENQEEEMKEREAENDGNTPQFSEANDFTTSNKEIDRNNQEFETLQRAEPEEKEQESPSPEKSLPESGDTYRAQIRGIDDIERLISERNKKVKESRKNRENRLSYTSRGSDSQYTFSNSKNLFISSTKQFNKYEMNGDSFGSPDAKMFGSKRNIQDADETKEEQRMLENDHIIKNLGKQERMLETFIPPSRVEPVPISVEHNDLPIAFQSSPDIISYHYEDTESPPKCRKTRTKLFQSPTHRKEEREDTHPEYKCNPDTIYAMRAKDLHCGRGSSPLRTKFKTPKSKAKGQKKSPSPLKKSTYKIEYFLDNGSININTPAKKQEDDFERESSPKTKIISDLKATNSSIKSFQRRCKVVSEDSQEKDIPQESPEQEQHKQRMSQFKTMEVSPLRNIPNQEAKTPNLRRSRVERKKGKASSKVRGSSTQLRSARSSNGLRENSRMAEVQRRKEEIFRKRQEELTAKLAKKEERRRMLSQNKWSYTPKQGDTSPVKFPKNKDLEQEDYEEQAEEN